MTAVIGRKFNIVDSDFHKEFRLFIDAAFKNNFTDNWDFYRFGTGGANNENKITLRVGLRTMLLRHTSFRKLYIKRFIHFFEKTINNFSFLYDHVEDDFSKRLLIEVLAFRLLGHTKVKISMGAIDYFCEMENLENELTDNDFILPNNYSVKQFKINLKSRGFPLTLYLSSAGIFNDFIFKQYELDRPDISIRVSPGDVVIDGGGCFGDTALYFASLTGESGNVISFEFIPGNIEVLNRNLGLNQSIAKNITIAKNALWSKSGIELFYKDMGPGSIIDFKKCELMNEGVAKTISIDDYIDDVELSKVDFIKLDIEGAEFEALLGAKQALKKLQPKLAIALYHSNEDFDRIPRLIKSINPNYKFYFSHATIHSEESVLFAV
jgi:FkbM family methyltransferase